MPLLLLRRPGSHCAGALVRGSPTLVEAFDSMVRLGSLLVPYCHSILSSAYPTRLVLPCCRGRVLGLFCNPGSISRGLMPGLFVGSCRKEELVEELGLWHSFCQITLRGRSMSHAPPPMRLRPNLFLFSEMGGSALYWWCPLLKPRNSGCWNGSRIVFSEFIVNPRYGKRYIRLDAWSVALLGLCH